MDPELINDLTELNKLLHFENISIRNRLLSIEKDTKFINKIHENYYSNYPKIPNERCGNWYVPEFSTTSYFKSTDGHTNNWSFSTKRLNLHLLRIIIENNGILIIDSTRRGKKIPDSLSKTIPIWISIINKIINNSEFKDTFKTPKETVSKYENDRILDKLPEFYSNIEDFLDLIKSKVNEQEIKILKPFWIYPSCKEIPIFTGNEPFHPIIMISASEKFQDGENKINGFTYVQGAGDDHELWSNGLSPKIYYQNIEKFNNLINLNDNDVEKLINEIVNNEINKKSSIISNNNLLQFWNNDDIYRVNDLLYFGKINKNIEFKYDETNYSEFSKIIILDSSFNLLINENKNKKQDIIHIFKLDSNCKKSSKLLRFKLPEIINIVKTSMDKTLILCNNGEDLSIGVIICCLNINNNKLNLSKDSIRRDFIKLLDIRKLNPQRATLNSVNSYLLS